MYRGGIIRVVLFALAAISAAWGQNTVPAPIQAMVAHPLPTARSLPDTIVTGPDGNLWFTEYGASKIGMSTPAGVITEYPTPTANSSPVGIAAGADGNLWFAEWSAKFMAKITPEGVITEYPLLASGITADPFAVAAGPDGNMWFASFTMGTFGYITPAGRATAYQCTNPFYQCNAFVFAMTPGPDGKFWFVPSGSGNLLELSTGGAFSQITAGVTVGSIEAIARDSAGNVWLGGSYGLIEVNGISPSQLTNYPVGSVRSIATSQDGSVWFTGYGSGMWSVGRLSSSGEATFFGIPFSESCSGGRQVGIAIGPDGNAWFTGICDRLFTLQSPGGTSDSLPTLSPASLTFSTTAEVTPASQTITLTDGSSAPYTVRATSGFSVATRVPWLSVSPSGSLSSSQILTVTADPTGLSTGTYAGDIAITVGNTAELLSVVLTIAPPAGGNVTVSPASVSFAYTTGGASPARTSLAIHSALDTETQSYSIPYTVSTSVTSPSGGSWLSLSPASASGTTPATIMVNANPSGLPAGTYTGSVTITPTGGAAVTVPVTLTVTTLPVMTASPASLSFTYQPGTGASPAAQGIQVGEQSGLAAAYTVMATSTPAGWLSASPSSGTAPGTVAVTVSAASLTKGTYQGSVVVTPPVSGGKAVTIPVSLTVTDPPLLVSPSALYFTYPSFVAPATQSFQVTAPGNAAIAFRATGGVRMSVSPTSGTTPATITVSVTPAGVQAQPGTGSDPVFVVGAAPGDPETPVAVTLNVTQTVLSASQPSISFNYQPGGANPAPVSFQVTGANGTAVPVSATITQGWLSVTPLQSTTPVMLAASVSPAIAAALSPGVYTAEIGVYARYSGSVSTPDLTALRIPVTLTIANPSSLSVSPTSLGFSYQIGGSAPAGQSIRVSAAGSTTAFTAAVTDGASWLSVLPGSGNTPGTVTVSVATTNLVAGSYSGSITITPSGNPSQQVQVPVHLTVTGITISPSASSLSFTYRPGGSVPAPQSIQLTAAGGAAVGFEAVAELNSCPSTASCPNGWWFWVTSTTGTTPATLQVIVSPTGLPAGTYGGAIKIDGGTWSLSIPVTLTVGAAPQISITPNALRFSYQAGSSAPPAQSIQVAAQDGSALSFSAGASSTGNWLAVTPASGTTPASVSVSINPDGLAAGTFGGSVAIDANGAASAVSIPITLTVTGSGSTSAVALNGVTNAASYSNAAVSPGEVVSLFGTGIGPASPAFLTLDATGKVATSLGGVTVAFGGAPAPLTYASATQVNAVVPYEVSGNASVPVVVTYGGQISNQLTVAVAATQPAIFTLNGSGSGPGAILNQDSSLNSQTNRAAKGSVVQVFLTGEGLTNPAQATGAVTPVNTSGTGPVTPVPQAPVTVLIDGQLANVEFAGEAPEDVAGVFQVDAVVPSGIASGAVPILVRIGGAMSQVNVTVWVQ